MSRDVLREAANFAEVDRWAAAITRAAALADEWEDQSASGVKIHCARRLRAALRGEEA